MPNKKVLIIEDEEDLCLLLKDYFMRKSCDVAISNTLEEGLSLLDKQTDVLFLDNNLPDGVGWSQAPGIAKDIPGIRIVFISAFEPKIPEMPELSRFSVIEKPISFSDLDKQFAAF